MPELVRMFVNGQAMRGGELNDALASEAQYVGVARTAAHYRFFSIRNEFPGLQRVRDGEGAAIEGELYEASYQTLRSRLLPREPVELELTVIELDDGSGSLSMCLRDSCSDDPGLRDITGHGGWRAFLTSREGEQ